MHTICHLTDFRNQEDPDEALRLRIEAKRSLWEFFAECAESLKTTYTNPEELAREIIGATIWTLHPKYEGIELLEETKCILVSLRIPVPDNHTALFTDIFTQIVLKKLAAQRKKHP